MGFNSCVWKVLKSEGGYVDDPTDRGGETNFGISKRSYPDLDIKNLTEKEAVKIYERDYWKPSKAERLPEKLQLAYFDMCVNMGQRNAVKILQKACNGKNRKKIAVDGGIGPQTIGATKRLEIGRLKSYRVLYYANLVHSKPKQERFWYGWFKRAID